MKPPDLLVISGASCMHLQDTVSNVSETYPVTLNGVLTVWFCNGLKTRGSDAVMRGGYDRALEPHGQLIRK